MHLYRATGHAPYLAAGRRLLEFCARCAADVFRFPPSGKLGMGSALLYAASGDQAARRAAQAVGGYLAETQRPSGYWELPDVPIYRQVAGSTAGGPSRYHRRVQHLPVRDRCSDLAGRRHLERPCWRCHDRLMSAFRISDDQVAQFQNDGYLRVPAMLDEEETGLLVETARADNGLRDHAFGVDDREGNLARLALWYHPGEDIYGMVSRSERIVDAMEKLLADEVYHYHSKMILKEARVGGAWEWHQDYGYWYQLGCLFPHMASVYIALDPATRENGCLQLLTGSHKLGRIEHGQFGGQQCADPEHTDAAAECLETYYGELEPGDALFFHANTLHRSAANHTDTPRWGLICCYNTKRNDPFKDTHLPRYTQLQRVGDDAIKRVGATGSAAEQRFMEPEAATIPTDEG